MNTTFNVTKTNEPIVFRVDNDTFEAIPAAKLPAYTIATYFQDINEGDLFQAHDYFFKAALTKDSYKRFCNRIHSKIDPITISTLGDITTWLLGDEYLGGKTFGRSQAIIAFATDGWEDFDSWCLMHSIHEPWELPSYRFGALLVFYLKDDKTQESLETIDEMLSDADSIPHPFLASTFKQTMKAMGGILSTKATTIDNVIYDPRLTELPVEERKRREAMAAGKPYRVPEWWGGEKKAYKVSQSMMKTLPKKIGPVT